jgi:hypothetical protein
MRKFISCFTSALLSLTLVALAGCAVLLVVHGIDRAGRAWAGLSVRVARLEQQEAGAFDRVIEIERQIAGRVDFIGERVIDLPEDGNQWHTILLVCPNWRSRPAERRAEAMFHSEPLLASLKHQTHWHLIATDQQEFEKFRALVDVTPCLIVERANGQVVYRESGPGLGRFPHALTHAIKKEIQRHCPDGRCLPLHPVPGKDEEPPRDEVPAVLREEISPAENRHKLAPVALVAALGGLLGFARKFRMASGQ